MKYTTGICVSRQLQFDLIYTIIRNNYNNNIQGRVNRHFLDKLVLASVTLSLNIRWIVVKRAAFKKKSYNANGLLTSH